MNEPQRVDKNDAFKDKWQHASTQVKSREEWTIFVEQGEVPRTQRQFSLFWYLDFIRRSINGKGYQNGIELGCGRGTASLYLTKYEGMHMTLSDVSEDAIALAKKNFSHHGAAGDFVVADAQHLPFPNDSFDLVCTIGLFEHLEDDRPYLREVLRVLRPGGRFISLNIPKKWSIQSVNTVYRTIIRPFIQAPLKKDYYRNSDTPDMYAARAKEAGFEQIQITYVNAFPLFVPVSERADRMIAAVNRFLVKIRRLWRPHPLVTGKHLAQAHFLIADKPIR